MTNSERTNVSKLLSFVLRHKPDSIDLTLNEHGWANIDELILKTNKSGKLPFLNLEQLKNIVRHCDKKRFIISDDGCMIRANQGHSINVNLQLTKKTPPEYLYHGTAERFIKSIEKEGLKAGERQHVHLSTEIEVASNVGKRYGKPILLVIKALEMHQQGFEFYLSENNVWLTKQVPTEFISKPN